MESGAPERGRRILEWVLIAAFAGALVYPSVDPWMRPQAERTLLAEYRSPAKLPERPAVLEQWLAYPQGFEAWFNDNVGLRDKLVRWHNLLDWYGFGISPTSKLVLGEDAWIYYADDKSIDVYRGLYPLSERELEGWRRALTARRDWLSARHIRYLFVIVPNKDRVYPEHLPEALKAPGVARSDQWVAYLREHSDLDVLDLRPAILAEKKNDREGDYAYFRLGTHWTDRGGYAAYVALVERLKPYFPVLSPIPREAFDVVPGGDGDNWAPRLYMADLLSQTNLAWRLRSPGQGKFDKDAAAFAFEFESTNPDASLPRAFILHDSFGPTLRPWLAESFSHAFWTWGWNFETNMAHIEADHPDIVIEMFVDRTFVQDYPQVSGVEDPSVRQAAFSSSSEVILRLDSSNGFAGMKPYGKAELVKGSETSRAGLALRCRTGLDGAVIPAPQFPASSDVIVSIEILCHKPSVLDLFFQKKDEPTFERKRVCSEKLEAGKNQVFIRLFAGNLAGRMFVHLREPELYVIKSIEVRAVHD